MVITSRQRNVDPGNKASNLNCVILSWEQGFDSRHKASIRKQRIRNKLHYRVSIADWALLSFKNFMPQTLPEKGPNTELFLVRIFPYLYWIRENTDQKKLRIWTLFTQWKCVENLVQGQWIMQTRGSFAHHRKW